eukprot:CAMPEP_0119153258 /NCGR_PEP_ID=MMETSP1310-20130426/48965_1 /TAXON_ID=464262 /ORGANISM="Genus nov. species nov., Strain RCC2339" /LENGTH=149 /DNA_ID=CAMNT_0007145695 /DNA_START=55 /DNA_END=501 /DNA_ORIENTATION=-
MSNVNYCYLLTSLKPTCKYHTYIGYTTGPPRRLRQHNGELQHGARRTSAKRPWEMVLVVEGFPTNLTALRFEWAWQNPHRSNVLKHIRLTRAGGKRKLKEKIMYLHEMLNVNPWRRLPLTVHWLTSEYDAFKSACKEVPSHMVVKVSRL